MQFTVGDKVVHPHHGPGQITAIERKQFLGEAKRYYVIEIPTHSLTVYVPRRQADNIGIRPAMSRARLARVMAILRSRPAMLPEDYKERQEKVWEKLKTSQSIQVAEVVRDLTWRERHAHLTKKDAEYLQRAQEFLAAEMALLADGEISEASKTIDAMLADDTVYVHG
jgi:CarD family transcriptional regulator